MPMSTKLGWMVTYLEGMLPIKLPETLVTATMPMTTKFGRVVTYPK